MLERRYWNGCIAATRAAERLAGARGKFYSRGPYVKKNFPEKIFSDNKPPPPRRQLFRSKIQGLYLNFSCQISVFSPKNRYLVLCAEIFNTQKRLEPNKKISGAPSTPGQFAPPPSRRPWLQHVAATNFFVWTGEFSWRFCRRDMSHKFKMATKSEQYYRCLHSMWTFLQHAVATKYKLTNETHWRVQHFLSTFLCSS
jgi:hypothetical protein